MTPRRLTPAQAAHAANNSDLIPWTEYATLTGTPRGTIRTWMDRGQLATYTVINNTGQPIRHIQLTEAATLEHTSRTTRRPGPKRH